LCGIEPDGKERMKLIRRVCPVAAGRLAVVLLIGMAGCGTTEPRGCTEIGCNPGVTVDFSGAVPTDFMLEVRSTGTTPFTIECSRTTPCGSGVFAYDILGDTIEVVVTRDGKTMTQTFIPTYEETRPNGPGCDPVCLKGRIDFMFPS